MRAIAITSPMLKLRKLEAMVSACPRSMIELPFGRLF